MESLLLMFFLLLYFQIVILMLYRSMKNDPPRMDKRAEVEEWIQSLPPLESEALAAFLRLPFPFPPFKEV
jgi:cell division FtsZ-interacting protein ZapD